MRAIVILCIVLLSFPALTSGENRSFTNDTILRMVQNNLPPGWEIVEEIPDQIPWGHYWGLEHKGRRGQEIIIQGPVDVNVCWCDHDGKTHSAAVAKEALELWIMPPEYGQGWKRHFMPHRPISAELIASGGAGRVYGFQTQRIVKKNELDALVKQATHVCWPNSPHDKQGPLSWKAWRKDLRTILKIVVKKSQ